LFPSQTFAINMQIKTALFIALAIGCASAENATYIGCYKDNGPPTRDLPVFFCSNGNDNPAGPGYYCADDPSGITPYAGKKDMTTLVCSALCKEFKFFGLQDGGECYCGNDYGNQGGKAPESDCNMICSGSPIEICGDGARNSIYAQPPSMYQTNNAATSAGNRCNLVGNYVDEAGNSQAVVFNGMNFNSTLENVPWGVATWADGDNVIHQEKPYTATGSFDESNCDVIHWSSGGCWTRTSSH
jgi:hypothetical protein